MSIAMSNILLKKEIFQKYDDIATQIILQTFFYISFPSKYFSLSHMHKFRINISKLKSARILIDVYLFPNLFIHPTELDKQLCQLISPSI